MKSLMIGLICAASAALPAFAGETPQYRVSGDNTIAQPKIPALPLPPLFNARAQWTTSYSAYQALPTQAQWSRAQRAAALINADQCREAMKLATDEGDRFLAGRVKAVCEGRS